MNAFLVELENKPRRARPDHRGDRARKGVDITGVSGSTCGSSGSVALIDATTRPRPERALQDAGADVPRDGGDEGADRDRPLVRSPRPAGGWPMAGSTSRP